MELKPLNNYVVVKPIPKEENKAGIILPDAVEKELPEKGEIIAVNPDCKQMKIGDTVIFKKYNVESIQIDEDELFIVSEPDIISIYKL